MDADGRADHGADRGVQARAVAAAREDADALHRCRSPFARAPRARVRAAQAAARGRGRLYGRPSRATRDPTTSAVNVLRHGDRDRGSLVALGAARAGAGAAGRGRRRPRRLVDARPPTCPRCGGSSRCTSELHALLARYEAARGRGRSRVARHRRGDPRPRRGRSTPSRPPASGSRSGSARRISSAPGARLEALLGAASFADARGDLGVRGASDRRRRRALLQRRARRRRGR